MKKRIPASHAELFLKDSETNTTWNDKLQFITLETSKFNKAWQECHTNQEKWLWTFCRLHQRNNPPENITNTIFESLTKLCDRNRFNGMENQEYKNAMLTYDQYKNFTDYAHEEGYQEGLSHGIEKGIAEGHAQGQKEILTKLRASGLSEREIQRLLEEWQTGKV